MPRIEPIPENDTMGATPIDTGTIDLLASLDEGVLTLTMNRPDARNALTRPMIAALSSQLAAAELDPAVKCIVLTGAGKGFCAGGDVKGMAASGDGTLGNNTIDGAIHRQRINQRATAGRLFTMPKPTIAALPGAAAGAGLSLALACDLRIMAANAIITTAFARVGFSGDYGGTYFMTQLIGAAKARELYFLSERVSADEALRLGLTNWVQYVRVVRAECMALRGRDFVQAAVAVGASVPRILLRHLLPNLAPSVVVISSLLMARMILFESSLSYLGLGVPPNTPTWGAMIADGRDYISTAWWVVGMPGLALFLTVVGINLIGDRLRDLLDPRLKQLEG